MLRLLIAIQAMLARRARRHDPRRYTS